MKISDFRILSGWTEKYKPALSKSYSSWDNSYCVRLVIVSLAVNIGKLQSLVSHDNFFFVNIKLVFNSFKIKNYFAYKDPIPNDLKSFLLYKFNRASCSSSYIGEICRHFKTTIGDHIKKDNKSHIFKHLHSSETCFDSYNSLCFKIIEKANSKLDLKIKET